MQRLPLQTFLSMSLFTSNVLILLLKVLSKSAETKQHTVDAILNASPEWNASCCDRPPITSHCNHYRWSLLHHCQLYAFFRPYLRYSVEPFFPVLAATPSASAQYSRILLVIFKNEISCVLLLRYVKIICNIYRYYYAFRAPAKGRFWRI